MWDPGMHHSVVLLGCAIRRTQIRYCRYRHGAKIGESLSPGVLLAGGRGKGFTRGYLSSNIRKYQHCHFAHKFTTFWQYAVRNWPVEAIEPNVWTFHVVIPDSRDELW